MNATRTLPPDPRTVRVMAAGRGALADEVTVELTVPDLPPTLRNRVYRVRLAWTD